MVDGFVARGADLIAVAVLVVAGAGDAAGIGHAVAVGGESAGGRTADGMAVGAVEAGDAAFLVQRFARQREHRSGRIDGDGAADAVAADADRGDSRPHRGFADLSRRGIGQRRIHVVGASRGDVLAVDLDIEAVVGEAVNRGQAGDAAVGGAVDAEQILQHPHGVGGGETSGGEPFAAER